MHPPSDFDDHIYFKPLNKWIHCVCFISDCLGSPAGLSTYCQIHDKILPKKVHGLGLVVKTNSEFVSPKKATSKEIECLQHAVLALEEKKITSVDKNAIINEYENSCLWEHGLSGPVTSSKKRWAYELSYRLSHHRPTHAQLHYETKPRSPYGWRPEPEECHCCLD